MRTTTALPLRKFVTFTLEPSGKVLCAAVIAAGFIISPEAVRERSAYQEAPPQERPSFGLDSAVCTRAGASSALAAMVVAAIIVTNFKRPALIPLISHGWPSLELLVAPAFDGA